MSKRRSLGAVLRQWPWLVLALATVFFATHYVVAYFFAAMDTETVVLAVFYHDIVEMGHPGSDWQWGGFSDLFPNVTTFFIWNFLCRDGLMALQLNMVFLFFSWLAASAGLAFVLKRPNKLSLCSIFLFLWITLICNFGLPREWGLYLPNPILQPVYHSGAALLCLVSLTVLISQLSGIRTLGFWSLFALVFLGGVSDALFFIVFLIPAWVTVVALTVVFPRRWNTYLGLALNLTLAGVAAHFLGPFCFPAPLAMDSYTHFDLGAARASLNTLWGELVDPTQHLLVFFVVLDILVVLGGIVGFVCLYFRRKKHPASPLIFGLMAFCSTAVFVDWAGAILTGDYQGTVDKRYLVVALVLPLFVIIFALHSVVLWRPWLEKILAVAVAAFAIAVAFIPQSPSGEYEDMKATIPFLKAVMKEHHIEAGFSDYWRSNLIGVLSQWTLQLPAVSGDGTINHWFNSLEWYGKGHPVREAPHFRLLYMPDPQIKTHFGEPDQIVYTSNQEAIWLYSDARSIRYNPFFGSISNTFLDDAHTVLIKASDLASETGKTQQNSRIAVAGQDNEGYLTRGPFISLAPAHYRVTFHYAYLAAPAADKLAVYDLLDRTGSAENASDATPLPYPGAGPQVFTHDVTVKQRGQTFEMRIYFRDSGTLRIDSLAVTYLGP